MNIQQPKWWVQWNADLVKRQRCASTFYRDWSDFKVSDISGSGIQQVIRTQKEGSADETKPHSCNCYKSSLSWKVLRYLYDGFTFFFQDRQQVFSAGTIENWRYLCQITRMCHRRTRTSEINDQCVIDYVKILISCYLVKSYILLCCMAVGYFPRSFDSDMRVYTTKIFRNCGGCSSIPKIFLIFLTFLIWVLHALWHHLLSSNV